MINQIAFAPAPTVVQMSGSPGAAVQQAERTAQQGSPVAAKEGETQLGQAAEESSRGRAAASSAASKSQQDGLAKELSPEELRVLEQLEQTDRKVRQHEMAHQIVGGPYTGSARYQYEIGPDGQRYAVAGRVSVDYGPVTGDPQATIEKMKTVIAAALAPADPSPADYQIAARARQNLLLAQLEYSQQQQQTRAGSASGVRLDTGDDDDIAGSIPREDPRVIEYSRNAEISAGSSGAVAQGRGTLRSIV